MKHINRYGVMLLVIALALLPALHPVQAQSDDDDDDEIRLEYIPGEVLMRLDGTGSLGAVAAQFQLTLKSQFGTQPIYQMTITDGSDPEQKADALRDDIRVIYAEPNYISAAPESQRRGGGSWAIGETGDGTYTAQWAPATVRFPEAHTRSRGANVIVAVLDTGVDPSHPALAGRLLPGYDFVNMDSDPNEEGPYGPTSAAGHGTHVAGLVALAAPDAQILPVRVLQPNGEGNLWVLAEALEYAVRNGADVINLSLGTLRRTELLDELIRSVTCADDSNDDDDDSNDDDDDSNDDDDDGGNDDDDDGGNDDDDDGGDSSVNDILDDDFCDDDDDDDGESLAGRGRGVVVVAAAGNSGDSVPQYPAAEGVRGSLAIAATTRTDKLAPFSTRGPWVNLAAPGDQIISSVPLASGVEYGVWRGSSMSAPLVAGTAALVRSLEPQLTAVDVADRLVTSGACIDAPMPRLDAAAALGAASGLCTVHLPLLWSSR